MLVPGHWAMHVLLTDLSLATSYPQNYALDAHIPTGDLISTCFPPFMHIHYWHPVWRSTPTLIMIAYTPLCCVPTVILISHLIPPPPHTIGQSLFQKFLYGMLTLPYALTLTTSPLPPEQVYTR
ncbi:hypothetical protein BKA83DRAFT_4123035 [Pisolithus microcarpus]|nr:hypothetical protein BKA83DRAFT_4123035 [Pisolithus microcarpus]